MREPLELAWASGLFEGEGCFTTSAGGPRKTYNGTIYRYPRVVLVMTDKDTVVRFQSVVGLGRIYSRDQHPGITKPSYEWVANGFEDFQAILSFLWNGLGKRRRERAAEVLSQARGDYQARISRKQAKAARKVRENCADVPTELRQKLIVPTRNGKVNV